ncbi:MAG: response regulator transcription factor [Rhodoferax sp.]|nr:response regulator transcription factor [Rhodoferax sp.]
MMTSETPRSPFCKRKAIYVIDLNLPEEDGLSLTKRLRKLHPSVGIVITTARAQIGDKVVGYTSGADLYLTKPIHPQELIAGISSLSYRLKIKDASTTGLELSLGSLVLRGPLNTIDLTSAEATLLAELVRAPGQTLERWQLLEIFDKQDAEISNSGIEMRVSRLRKKLEATGVAAPHIKSLHKVGYALCCQVVIVR